MLFTLTTEKSVGEAAAALHAAVVANQFGVMQVHNLKETMAKKGVDFEHECMVFDVCNPHQAKKVLGADMSLSTALPCRISVYEENGKTMLSTIIPTQILTMYNVPEMKSVAVEVEGVIKKIMQDAAMVVIYL